MALRDPRIRTLTAALVGCCIYACGGSSQFVDSEADIPYYETVGIIPFRSLAQDRLAGEKVANIFFTQLLTREFAQVVEPGVFSAAMTRVRGGTPPANSWSSEQLSMLGSEANVQGVFVGTVRDYGIVSVGRDQFPLVSFELRLIDTATGRVVWSASDTRRGGPAFPIFGFGEVHTLGELCTQMCQDLLQTLPRN